jgi:hypothetical protein
MPVRTKPLKHKLIRLPDMETEIQDALNVNLSSFPGMRDSDGKYLYRDLWQWQRAEWDETVRAYETNPGSFYNAWHYLEAHPIYWRLMHAPEDASKPAHWRNVDDGWGVAFNVSMYVMRVHPETRKVTGDPALNTHTEIWLETGENGWPDNSSYHNYRIDCVADTYEEAIIRMARRVHSHYGNDRRRCDPQYSERRRARRVARTRKRYAGRSDVTVSDNGTVRFHGKEQEKSPGSATGTGAEKEKPENGAGK